MTYNQELWAIPCIILDKPIYQNKLISNCSFFNKIGIRIQVKWIINVLFREGSKFWKDVKKRNYVYNIALFIPQIILVKLSYIMNDRFDLKETHDSLVGINYAK